MTEVAYGYSQSESLLSFIAPTVNVASRSGKVIQFGKEQFAIKSTKRTPYAEHKRSRVSGYGTANYVLEQHSHEAEVSWEEIEEAANGALGYDLKEMAVLDAVAIIEQSLEAELYGLVTNPSFYEPTNAIAVPLANRFSTATSDPEALVRVWKSIVRQQIGRYPNKAVMAEDVFNALSLHPQFRDKIKYTSSQSATAELIAAWLGLAEIRIATRLQLNPTTGALVDMFPAGTMLLFVDGTLPSNQIGSNYGASAADRPIFTQAPGIGRSTATFAQTYVLNDGLRVGRERINEDRDVISHTVRIDCGVYMTSVGATNRAAAGILLNTLV